MGMMSGIHVPEIEPVEGASDTRIEAESVRISHLFISENQRAMEPFMHWRQRAWPEVLCR